MMKKILITLLLSMSFNGSTFVIWPNASAPCNTTLQACINASSDGEYIEIQTNGPINENIFTSIAVSLVAGTGYNPVFSAFNEMQIHANTSGAGRTISVKGLTFELGQIRVTTVGGEPITFIIENNIIMQTQIPVPFKLSRFHHLLLLQPFV